MSENYENVATQTMDSPEVELDLNELIEDTVNPELGMTTGQKLKVLFMRPMWSAIVKWVFMVLGIVGLVFWLIANNVSRETGESMSKTCGGIKNMFSNIFGAIPVSMLEIVVCAAAVGIFAYLIFIIVRCIQIKGTFHKAGLWVQFLYTVIAVACVFVLLFSMCYGVYGYRQRLSKLTKNAYSAADVTNMEFAEAMLYLIDKTNNSFAEGKEKNHIFFTASGETKFQVKGDALENMTKEINKAYKKAAKDIKELEGPELNSKALLFTGLYTSKHVASIYSPITGEVCINTEYSDVLIPMQIAKSFAMQRGFTDSDTAEFLAFLVCTQYSDNKYINYSGYFNAYMSLSSKLYQANGKDLHLYLATALNDEVKKEYVNVVKDLDELYGVSSDLEFKGSANTLTDNNYNLAAKLVLVNLRDTVADGNTRIDKTEYVNYGDYCNYLTNFYKLDDDFQDEVDEAYEIVNSDDDYEDEDYEESEDEE